MILASTDRWVPEERELRQGVPRSQSILGIETGGTRKDAVVIPGDESNKKAHTPVLTFGPRCGSQNITERCVVGYV